ncbi:MAG: DUF2341 domain-containing protein [Patescibacteria group bacterium]|jgi:hypothetical protein
MFNKQSFKQFIDNAYSFIEPLFKEPKKHLKTWLVVIIFLTSIWSVVFFLNRPEPAQASWWNETWLYRKAVNISNDNGENLTDFQVAVTIDTASLITDGKLQNDCADLRFTDINGKVIPHWIEENNPGCNDVSTKVWVKVPTVYDGTDATTIYTYYGNASATNSEDSKDVFEFFDDFSTDTTDNYAWTTVDTNSPTNSHNWNQENNWVEIRTGDNDAESSSKNTNLPSSGHAHILMTKRLDYPSANTQYLDIIQDSSNYYRFEWQGSAYSDQGIYKRINASTVDSSEETGTIDADDTQYRIDTYWTPNKMILEIDGVERKNINTTNTTEITPTSFLFFNSQINQDWELIFISKYTSIEPTTSLDSEEISPGPVAYWKFDEGTGTTANDSSGQGNDGTINGATWQTEDMCISGKCLEFDGDDYLEFGNEKNLDLENDLTVCFWTKFNSTSGDQGLLHRGSISNNYYSSSNYTFRESSSKLIFAIGDNTENNQYTKQEIISETEENNWYYVCAGTEGGNMFWSVNGNNKNEKTLAYETKDTQNNVLLIGKNGGSEFFNGFMDEVKIYPYARTEDQIKSDYAAGLAGVGSTKGSSAIMGSSGLQSALSDGLVGYWKMDESSWDGTADEVIDSSGNGNHGQGVGATPPTTGAGKFGNGGLFDGSDDLVKITHTDTFNFDSDEITISTWINPTSLNTNDFIIGKSQSYNGFSLRLDSSNASYLEFYIGDGSSYYFTSDQKAHGMTTGNWYQVTATFNGSTMDLFVNGESIGSASANFSPSWGTHDLIIGADAAEDNEIPGKIDEVRIYNRALSPAEVKALYEWAPGPVAHYTFDDSSNNTTLADISGYGNDGTWSGSSTNRYAPGKFGSAGVFNGSDDYVNVASLTGNSFPNFTICAWTYANTAPINDAIFAYNTSGDNRLYLTYNTSTSIKIGLSDWNPTISVNNLLNKWSFNCLTLNGIHGKYYIDGILTAENESINVDLPSGNLKINHLSYPFNGLIDDVRIYNYARTQKQILEDMQGSMPGAARMPQPIAHWRFDEGYGTTVNNSGFGGSDLDGTLGAGDSAPSWTNEGKVGKALEFDGDKSIISITSNETNFTNEDFTVSVWTKATISQGSNKRIVAQGTYQADGWEIFNSDGKVELRTYQTGTFQGSSANYNDDGKWHHIIVIRKNTTAKFYIDGVLINEGTGHNSPTISDDNLEIGGNTDHAGYYYSGLIDEVKIYNYALSEEEVRQDYNQGKALVMGQSSANTGSTAPGGSASQEYCVPGSNDTCRPPVAEWNFEENTGTTARDTSGNDNSGNLGVGDSAPSWDMGHNSSGASLNFDGNDYVDTADINSIELNEATISFWGKINNISKDNDFITKGTHSTNQPLLIWFDSVVGSGGDKGTGNTNTLSVITYDGSTQHWVAAPTNTINDTDWHFYSIVINPTNNKIEILVDGILVEQNTKSWNGIRDTATALRLGNPTPSSSAAGLDGLMDNVRIYDYARTPAQIAWDYNRGGPVGWWKLDECQGTTAYDSSGNANHGTINIGGSGSQDTAGSCGVGNTAAAWYNGREGRINSAMSFDGVDDYVDVGNDSSIANFSSNFTISAWIHPNSGDAGGIVARNNRGSPWNHLLQMMGETSVRIRMWSNGTDAGTGVNYYFYPDNLVGKWTHLLYTFDGSKVRAYVNGKEINNWDRTDPIDIGQRTIIGEYTGSSTFNGLIDDVRIYNYALTGEQIRTVYNQGSSVRFGD